MHKAERTGLARSDWSGRTAQAPSETPRTPAARALALQRTAGNRAVVAMLQRDRTKTKKTKNARLRKTQEEQERTYTLPEKRKGSPKKSQRIKHDEDYEKAMTKFARAILIDSEGNVHVGGHAKGRHGGVTDEYLIARNIPVASAFDDGDDQVKAVVAILMEARSELQQWLEDGDSQHGVTIDRPDDVHVRAFRKAAAVFTRMEETDFGYVKAFFRKDAMSAGNPWGLITCYPSQAE